MLNKLITNKILINSILSLFWLWLLSEKIEKLLQGDLPAIMLSLLYILMLALNGYGIAKALKERKTKKQ
jgi:hypothetical protein